MGFTKAAQTFICGLCAIQTISAYADPQSWQIGPFCRDDVANPILMTNPKSSFVCPLQNKEVHWESDHILNPGAVICEGKVYLLYRAEDDYGNGVGFHTSRIGLAESSDAISFKRSATPVLFPDHDNQRQNEFPGGCEDPRIIETEAGMYVMMYTQWNREVAALAVATSSDLVHWVKHGYAFEGSCKRQWSKSGSIVCRLEGDRLIAAKIHGKYWMYWGEGCIYIASSDDLISWQPLMTEEGHFLSVLSPRSGKFDSELVESGPPAVITEQGIVLIYNGKNAAEGGDPNILPAAYSAGQVLFSKENPRQMMDRCTDCFLTPQDFYEKCGQYGGGAVFTQGLVHFQNRWFLYYGMADSAIGVAITPAH